jgi:putative PEP-CTERM system TPR-repeat lipoprotein
VTLAGCGGFERELDRGRQALESGDLPTAIIHLRNAAQHDPRSAEARLLLSDVALAAGDVAAARVELDRAGQLGAAAAAVAPRELAVLEAEGRFGALLEALADSSASAPPNHASARHQAAALAGLGRMAEALKLYAELHERAPQDDAATLGLARTWMAVGQPQRALEVLEGTQGAASRSSRLAVQLASAYLATGRLQDAEAAYARAVSVAAADYDAAAGIEALVGLVAAQISLREFDAAAAGLARLAEVAPSSAGNHVLEAQLALARGRLEDAASAATRAVNRVPEDVRPRLLLASIKARQGQEQQAELHAQRILTQAPEFLPARWLLADLQLRRGDLEDAERTLAPLAGEQPDERAGLLLGRLALARGDFGAADYRFQSALAQSGSGLLRFDIAALWMRAGRPDEAWRTLAPDVDVLPAAARAGIREAVRQASVPRADNGQALERAADAFPDSPVVQVVVAQLVGAGGNTRAALDRLDRLLARDPHQAAALAARAALLAGEGQYDLAEETLRRLAALHPDNVLALSGLAELAAVRGDHASALGLLERLRRADPGAVEVRLQLARAAVLVGDVAEARALLDEVLAKSPRDAETLALAAVIEGRGGNWSLQRDLLVRAVAAAPEVPEYALALAEVEYRLENRTAARANVARALDLRPEWSAALAARAQLDLDAGDLESADAAARKLQVANRPSRPLGLALAGEVKERLGAHAEAAALFEQAYALAPSAILALNTFTARSKAGLPESDALLRDWLQRRPDDTVVRVTYAEAMASSGRKDDAIRQYERGLMHSPDAPDLLNNLAWLQFETGRPGALQNARRAVRSHPDHAFLLDTLGWILVHDGDLEEAVQVLARAAANSGGNPIVRYHYAYALAKHGDREAARREIDSVLVKDMPTETREAAMRLSENLR